MMKKLGLVLLLFVFSCNLLYSQISSGSNYLDISIKEELLMNDTISVNLLQIPLFNFNFYMYAKPGFSNFFETSNNTIFIDLEAYNNHVDDMSIHLADIRNSFLYYAFESRQSIYSFGLSHRFFMEASFSKELVSLIIDGNYQYLNQIIDLDDQNYISLCNYFSFFFGYTKSINENFLLSTKLKLIKGLAEFGTNNQNFSFLLSDNFETVHNPFSAEINTDIEYFINSDYHPLSNLGFATDLYLDYNYNDMLKFYTLVSDLGFIVWEENQYASRGDFQFDGLDYDLDQVLSNEFNNLQDTLMNIFDIKEDINVHKLRVLPFDIRFGVKYAFDDRINQLNASYTLKKLYNNLLHTGRISYVRYFDQYHFSLIPSYSFNKFNYVNFSIMLNKKWKNGLYTNIYLENMMGVINQENTSQIGCGLDFYILF